MKQLSFGSYFNTTRVSGSLLRKYQEMAKGQEKKVLEFYIKYANGRAFSPDDIHALVFSHRTPVTSVRRAMTMLTKKGFLIKTPNKKIGYFGRETYTWELFDGEG